MTRREAELKKKNETLKQLEAQLSKNREAIDEEIEARLKERLTEAEKKATGKLAGEYSHQLKDGKPKTPKPGPRPGFPSSRTT